MVMPVLFDVHVCNGCIELFLFYFVILVLSVHQLDWENNQNPFPTKVLCPEETHNVHVLSLYRPPTKYGYARVSCVSFEPYF